MKKWGLKMPVYATSAKKGLDFEDNMTVYNLIKSPWLKFIKLLTEMIYENQSFWGYLNSNF